MQNFFIFLSIILSIIAVIPVGVYFSQKVFYKPEIFFRIGGEQTGEPIQIAMQGDSPQKQQPAKSGQY